MKENDAQVKQPSVGRRSLLRGGAVLAGAGLAGTALAQPASAGAIDYVELGQDNAETTSTELTVNAATGDADVAALKLNNADGPSLYLQPLDGDWNGSLKLGEIANTEFGPLIGVNAYDGPEVATSFLATGIDLESLPITIPTPPTRLVDTRTAAGRKYILASSPNALDARGKLTSGSWIDIIVTETANGFDLPGVFANLTAVAAEGTGWLTIQPGENYPVTSTLNVVKGQTVANGGFTAVRTVDNYFVVRVYTSATCWVIVDLTGAVVQGAFYSQTVARAAGRRPSLAKKFLTKVARRS